jgi:hypothetical protein
MHLFVARRPKTVFEVISELWNSSDINPIAPPSDCHSDYQSATDCSFGAVTGFAAATPQRIEDIFTSMRSDLLRIISRREQSGQGEGGRDDGGDEPGAKDDNESSSMFTSTTSEANDKGRRNVPAMGSLYGRPARATQSRSSFLNGKPSYLLYFWEVADAHQLLQSSLQHLTNSTGAADASSAPSATMTSSTSGSATRGRRRQHQETSPSQNGASSLVPLAQSIKDLAESQRQLVLDRAEDCSRERQLEEQSRQSERSEQCRKRVFDRRSELNDLARQYRRLNAGLDPSDTNSQRLSDFYVSEGCLLQEEIDRLDNNNDNLP